MQYKEMAEVDLKLALLSGGSINVENLQVAPYKLREIKDFGYSKYMRNLQWITISIDDFINSVEDVEKREYLRKQSIKAFDFYIKLGGKDFLEMLLTSLKMIFKSDDIRVLDDGVIAIDFVKLGIFELDDNGKISVNSEKLDALNEDEVMLIHRENFDDIVNVVKLQNYLEKPSAKKESDENPVDEETKKLMEHMKQMREKVEAKKKAQKQADKGDSDIDISDIISAVSSKSNSINKLNIWDLTLYQLYDEYARLELIDNYDFSIKAMMAGAEKVDLKHWSSKL
jgi:hypothetical protein